jgi:hypothetical protein
VDYNGGNLQMNRIYLITEADAREHLRILRNLARRTLRFAEPAVSFTELSTIADVFERACKPTRDPDIPDLVLNNSPTGDAS